MDAMELRDWIVAERTCPSESCVRNVLKEVLGASFELAIRREAKNARTNTMRIGKAALLKNRLMGSTVPVGRARVCGVYWATSSYPEAALRRSSVPRLVM